MLTAAPNTRAQAADVWACGVSLYILVAGAFPFLRLEEERRNDIERMQRMFPRILAGDFQPLPDEVRGRSWLAYVGGPQTVVLACLAGPPNIQQLKRRVSAACSRQVSASSTCTIRLQ